MSIYYYISECKNCQGFGELVFYIDIKSNKVYIACDECCTMFDSPEKAVDFKENSITDDYGLSRPATLEEIKEKGWQHFIKDFYETKTDDSNP